MKVKKNSTRKVSTKWNVEFTEKQIYNYKNIYEIIKI